MASGTLGADNSREKHRWGDGNKVYTRKIHNKGIKNTTTPAAANATTTSANNNNNGNNNVPQTLAPEEANSSQPRQTVSRFDAASDDTSSHNHLSQVTAPPNGGEAPKGNGVVKPLATRVENRVIINLEGAKSKNEIRELRKKLVSELDQVRSLRKMVEVKEVELIGNSQHSANDVVDMRGLVRVNSDVGSVGHQELRPFRQLSVSLMENNLGVGEFLEKEKRTPKANQYYRNSDFLLGKDRLPHPESNKKLKSNGGKKHGGEMEYGFGVDRYRSQVFKSCSNLLQRLMKHKHGWVFNEPVNAKALGLHDYHQIIKHPMDLGTVKSRLAQNFYKSPREFAEDVRLTFRNAMTYNPKGQDVHVMAEQLSDIFEERWAIIEAEYNPNWRYEIIHDTELPTPTSRRTAPPPPPPPPSALQMRSLDRSESMTVPVDPKLKPNIAPVIRTPVPKKPKAKDPNKRDMTYEEKQKLSTNLQSLPSDKLDGMIQIIKKRNTTLSQHDDEIEVDIDTVDAETLWELDRYVTNYKKSLSKNKRKAEIAQARALAGHAISGKSPAAAALEPPKETKTDDKNVDASSPVQVDRQGDNASRSSSSSSSSSDSGSSSSDSDSDSSSADGSDAGHSPNT